MMENNKELRNFVKLEFILRKATFVLRDIFMNRWKQMNGKEWLNNEKMGNEFIKKIGSSVYCSAKKFQKLCLESGSIDKWDLSLLCKVLIGIKFTINGNTNTEFEKQIMNENEGIKRLTLIRNKCAHNPNMDLSDEEFNQLSNQIICILVSFGESEEDLELLKNININDFETKFGINQENGAKAALLKEKGNEYFRKEKFKESINAYSGALQLKGLSDEEMAVLYSNRSVSYLSLYKSQKVSKSLTEDHNDLRYWALMDAKAALQLNPFWWRAFYRIGCAYDSLNKYSKAINNFNKSIAMNPSKEEVKSARDLTRLKFGKENRFEHLDTIYLPQTKEEGIQEINSRGFCINEEMIKRMEESLTQKNDPIADVLKGHRFRYDLDGVQQDYEKAAKCYEIAVDKGSAVGFYNLAQMTVEGKGVKQDSKKAFSLMESAAKQSVLNKCKFETRGITDAQHSLGLWHYEGIGVPKDVSLAIHWYRKASENGSATAANNIGLLYMNGDGLEVNYEKAIQFLTLSHSRNGTKAMYNMAICHLNFGDIEKARLWYKRAIDSGDLKAVLEQKEFEKKALDLENSKQYLTISKWETKNGLNSDGLTIIERSQRMLSENLFDSRLSDELISKTSDINNKPLLPRNVENIDGVLKFDLSVIEQYVKMGSIFAQRMQSATNYLLMSESHLISTDEDSTVVTDNDINFVQNFANCMRAQQFCSALPLSLQQKAMVSVNKVLKSTNTSKSQLDIDARVCYCFLYANSFDECIVFLNHCIQKYPKQWFFHLCLGCMYGFTQKFREGLKEVNKALKLSPNDEEILYSRAAALRSVENIDLKDVIKAYMDFLEIAPKDHRKVPDAYYVIASCFLQNDKDFDNSKKKKFDKKAKKESNFNIVESKVYYDKGLEAEKIQLPFFLPYESNNKKMVEIIIKMFDTKLDEKSREMSASQESKDLNKRIISDEKLSNPNRIELIIKFREHASKMLNIKHSKDNYFATHFTKPSLKEQKAPKYIVGLKAITLSDMDLTRDHVYEGFAMEITFIEDAITGMASIATLIQDNNYDIQRCLIYNFKDDKNESIVQQTFGFGCKCILINPYMRLAMDGMPAIRVNDCNSFTEFGVKSRTDNMCRNCSSSDAKHVCIRCKRAYYCDKDCQSMDWKVFKHKLICDKTNVK